MYFENEIPPPTPSQALRAREALPPRRREGDFFERGIHLTLFLFYGIIKMRTILKMESRRAGRLISYCGSSPLKFSFLTKNEIEDFEATCAP